ncbi:hypothetical protein NFI96_027909, partial [Prochilodus magdalenae]
LWARVLTQHWPTCKLLYLLSCSSPATLEHYKAGMLLSGVGDALGFRNQLWEYNESGPAIHQELQELGGLKNITVELPDWPVSDDTVLHLATAEALVTGKEGEELLHEVASCYVEGMKDMEGRKPGPSSILGRCPQDTAPGQFWFVDDSRSSSDTEVSSSTAVSDPLTPPPRQCHCSAENDPPPPYYLLCGGPVGVLTIEEQGVSQLKPGTEGGYRVEYNPEGTGCGAAMRSMCIGLRNGKKWENPKAQQLMKYRLSHIDEYARYESSRDGCSYKLAWENIPSALSYYFLLPLSLSLPSRYPRPEQLSSLVAVAVETGRMTHPHPTGFLGAVASALFTAYAVQRRPITTWGLGLVKEACPVAQEFVKTAGYAVSETERDWGYFTEKWEWYLELRGLSSGTGPVTWPDKYGPSERDEAYKSFSFSGWAGRSGHDAPMIALDALLGAGSNWEELMSRAGFHGGDCDSTAVIACCCWGLLYGTEGVPPCNYSSLEYRDRLEISAEQLYKLSH